MSSPSNSNSYTVTEKGTYLFIASAIGYVNQMASGKLNLSTDGTIIYDSTEKYDGSGDVTAIRVMLVNCEVGQKLTSSIGANGGNLIAIDVSVFKVNIKNLAYNRMLKSLSISENLTVGKWLVINHAGNHNAGSIFRYTNNNISANIDILNSAVFSGECGRPVGSIIVISLIDVKNDYTYRTSFSGKDGEHNMLVTFNFS